MEGDDFAEILRQIEREVEEQTAQLVAKVEAMRAALPISPIDGAKEEPDERERLAEVPGRDLPGPNGVVWRTDYVPKDDDSPYVKRGPDGLPVMRLVDAGDRLVIWSPVNDGGLINPRSPTLRTLGLIVATVRGGLYRAASKEADLRKGRPVELRAEPDNPHGRHAVAVLAPGRSAALGYVQRGRSRAVFDRLQAGEALGAICLRGSAPGREDWAAHILIGADTDLEAMTS